MNGEHGRHECAWPKRARHLLEHQKKQQHRYRMQEHISDVMAAGLQPEQLAVEHVRNRRERMSVPRMRMGKRAEYAVHRESSGDDRVLINIRMIVEIDEIVPQSLTKNEPRDCNQSEADIQRCESQRGALF